MLLTSVSPATVSDEGGELLELTGTFPVGKALLVHIGTTGSSADQLAYSGVPGQGNVVYARSTTTLRVWTRSFEPNSGPLYILVRAQDGSEVEATLDACLTVVRNGHSFSTFSLRQILPPRWATGPRGMDQLGDLVGWPFLPVMSAKGSTLYHFVADDYDSDTETLEARRGGVTSTREANPALLVDSSFRLDKLGAEFRQAIRGEAAPPVFSGAPNSTKPFVAGAGSARTYELIVKLGALANFSFGLEPSSAAPGSFSDYFFFTLNRDPGFYPGSHSLGVEINNDGDIEVATAAYAIDALWHYWTIVFDSADPAAPTIKVYDGETLAWSSAISIDLTGWALPSAPAVNCDLITLSLSTGDFLELMVHNRALSADEIKARTKAFRAFGG